LIKIYIKKLNIYTENKKKKKKKKTPAMTRARRDRPAGHPEYHRKHARGGRKVRF
jgi:hypothetical protein